MINLQQKNLTFTDTVEFSGVVISKSAGTEFTIKLTKFPNKIKIPDSIEVFVKAKLSGRIVKKTSKSKIAVYDNVMVAISYESAKNKTGTIVKRERKQVLVTE